MGLAVAWGKGEGGEEETEVRSLLQYSIVRSKKGRKTWANNTSICFPTHVREWRKKEEGESQRGLLLLSFPPPSSSCSVERKYVVGPLFPTNEKAVSSLGCLRHSKTFSFILLTHLPASLV